MAEKAPTVSGLLGHAWSLGCLGFAFVGWWGVRHMYLRRRAGKEAALAAGVVVPPEEYTDRTPDFKYII